MTDFEDARQRWDRRFAGADGFLFGHAPNRWLVENAGWIPAASRVLCVADGEGRNSVWLAEQGHDVVAFDLSPVGVARARQFAARRGVPVDLRIADVAHWRWSDTRVDAIVAIFVQFASPATRARMFDGIREALAPGGVLVLEGYGPRQMQYRTGGPGILEHLYTLPMLLREFDGWTVLASRDTDGELAEGEGHKGRSHLVSLVVRKPG